MNTSQSATANRVFAELPNGDILIPAASAACPGFDAIGVCNAAATPDSVPCKGATWRYEGENAWRSVFRVASGVCPGVLLDPLGVSPVPGD